MKRIILSTVAAVLVITVSAFTIIDKASSQQTELYWYTVVDGVAKHQMPINDGIPITKDELEANASTLLPCDVGATTDCVRGFEQELFADAGNGQSESIQKD